MIKDSIFSEIKELQETSFLVGASVSSSTKKTQHPKPKKSIPLIIDPERLPRIELEFNPDTKDIAVHFPYSKTALTAIKEVSGRKWNKQEKVWTIPFDCLDELVSIFPIEKVRFTEELERVIEERELLVDKRDEWKRLAFDSNIPVSKYKFYTEPWNHQLIGFKFLVLFPSCGLLDECGLGKGKQAIDTAVFRKQRGLVNKCLVLCPNEAKYMWEDEIQKHSKEKFIVIEGTKQKRLELLKSDEYFFYIINYNILGIEDYIEALRLLGAEMIVADEVHTVKNPKARWSKGFLGLNAPFKVAMSGTPLLNKVEDTWVMLKWLDPMGFPDFYTFRDRYCIMGGFTTKAGIPTQVIGYRNISVFRDKLYSVAVRRLKSEVMDLPEKTYQYYEVEMDYEQMCIYDTWRETTKKEIENTPENEWNEMLAITRLLRLSQIADSPCLIEKEDSTACCKLDFLTSFLEDFFVDYPNNKIVIWSRFIKMLEMIYETSQKYGALLVYGKTPSNTRHKLVKKFREQEQLHIMVANPAVLGQGYSLTEATTAIFFDNSFSIKDRKQAEDRIHRGTSTGTVTIIDLVTKGTVDEYIIKTLNKKRKLFERFVEKEEYLLKKMDKEEFLELLGERN